MQTSLLAIGAAAVLPFSPLASWPGFVPIPAPVLALAIGYLITVAAAALDFAAGTS